MAELVVSWELLVGVTGIIGTIVAAWINLGNRLTKLETLIEMKRREEDVRDLRIASLEARTDSLTKELIIVKERTSSG